MSKGNIARIIISEPSIEKYQFPSLREERLEAASVLEAREDDLYAEETAKR